MIEVFKKIWLFAGDEQSNIKKSVAIGFIYAVFHMFQVGAIFFAISAIVEQSQDRRYIYLSLLMMLLSIIGRIICFYFSRLQQTHAGYFMSANKRIDIGNRLKSIPMGFFNENSMGEMTGITTTVLDEVENTVPMVLVNILSGFINAFVFILYVLIFDWRIGLIVVIATILYLFVTAKMEKKSRKLAPKRQESEAQLVDAVLENIRGMFIVKSFNLTRLDDKKIDRAIEYNRASNFNMEKLFTPYTVAQELVLKLFSVLIMVAAIAFYFQHTLSLTYCLMMIVVSFMIFGQIQSAGSGMAILRVAGSSIEHANKIDETPLLDENGQKFATGRHDIVLDHVHFSYGEKEILHDISLTIPNQSTIAVVGPSGSGKTTLCHLIARFWDVDHGKILIGRKNIKDYTLESLMEQISMVFQNVYLFNDTIENNIKFGVPEASLEMVKEAAKKACCDDFIEAFPDGYQTIIGEGGSSLSGGQKQRISIARAMLKDAPIIIFDEATANVDPENEDKLQKAMEQLMKNKTIIMIAHRLKTVRNADQIIVIDQGNIVQQGKHEQLIQEDGIYRNFVLEREKTTNWKL